MIKRGMGLVIVLLVGISLTGCATFGKKKTSEIDNLKNQISSLESQLQEKDQEINNLREALLKLAEEKRKAAPIEEKSRPTVKQIQQALKNAGFDPGPIDGKIGKKTKEAIRAFQKANGLVVDGRVGRQTWAVLSAYLEKKIK